MAIRLFGLTGGVASGKSTVAARFRERGLVVLDADQIARDVVATGSPGLAEVVEVFGEGVRGVDGQLDRAALAELVFADESKRRRLNAIVHPRIGAETARRGQQLDEQGVSLACYDAPLLVENGLADAFRPLVVVSLPAELQRARLRRRDGLDRAAAQQRIDAQLSLAEKVAVADFVIDNSGSLEALLARADEVLTAIRASLDAPRS